MLQAPIEFALLVDDACLQQFRHNTDETGAADALWFCQVDRDDHRIQSLRFNMEIFNGAAGGPHAMFDAAPFKCGAS